MIHTVNSDNKWWSKISETWTLCFVMHTHIQTQMCIHPSNEYYIPTKQQNKNDEEDSQCYRENHVKNSNQKYWYTLCQYQKTE